MRLRIFTEPQLGATYDQQLAMAQAAEALGFDAFFRSDHFLAFGGSGLPGPTDSWVTLGGLARETSRIRLGTLLTSATFRFPGPLAIAVAEVDAMSGGRVELGLGAGWYEQEHKAYAIPFPPVGERFERLEEQLAIVTGLWETPVGSKFSYSGRHYQVVDSPALPKPVQSPRPPVIVGGLGPRRTPRLAARFADEFNAPFARPEHAAQLFSAAQVACEVAGRDPSTLRLSAAITTICGVDDTEVARRAAAIGQKVSDLRMNGACGTPAEVVDRLAEWGEQGAGTLYLQLLDLGDLDQVRLLGEEVLPKLR
ncbi:MAG TPA: LLM class F420-dependent oxidoreductase [Acidimicrobiales bacterium]|nr:LLM class F420-dependent oxidoreductase [Acidimicrobiales bacterium]